MAEQNNANKRLAKNTMFLYFRMLLLMAVSLYASRVTLQVLGVDDFGIYNIVSGVVVLFAFLARSLNSASSRFLSISVAKGNELAIQKNFSTILVCHVFLMFIVFLLLETVGQWFAVTKLNIPEGRKSAANVVYQLAVVSTCLNIIRIPFNASIIANEQMNFYAYSSIVEGLLKLVIVWMLPAIPCDKLVTYSVLIMLYILIINIWYFFYCSQKFRGNRIVLKVDKQLLRQMLSFSGWNMLNGVADIGWQQGTNVILNMFYGVGPNAAMGITNQVRSSVFSLVTNLQTAANPQIIKAYATGEQNRFEMLVFTISKFSFLLMLLFTVPLCLNMDYVLQLWLTEVPPYAVKFTILILIFSLTDSLSGPLWTSVQANGKIKCFTIVYSVIIICNVPVTYILFRLGYGPEWTLYARIVINVVGIVWEVIYVRQLVGISIYNYLKLVLFPVVKVSLITFTIAFFASKVRDGFVGLVLTFTISTIALFVSTFLCGMTAKERMAFKHYLYHHK